MSDLQTIAYDHDGVRLEGCLALPEATGPRPAVMVMHDAIGLGAHVCDRARTLAAEGYVAFVTDMYGAGVARDGGDDYVAPFRALQDDPQLLRGRVRAGFDAIRSLPQVDPDRVAAIGFCFGGQCVLDLARGGSPVRAVVSFHGLLSTRLPAQAGKVRARILVLTGALDPYAPKDHVDAFAREMSAAEADWHLTVYGRGWHAWTDPGVAARPDIPGLRYDAVLDRLSWRQALDFLAVDLAD